MPIRDILLRLVVAAGALLGMTSCQNGGQAIAQKASDSTGAADTNKKDDIKLTDDEKSKVKEYYPQYEKAMLALVDDMFDKAKKALKDEGLSDKEVEARLGGRNFGPNIKFGHNLKDDKVVTDDKNAVLEIGVKVGNSFPVLRIKLDESKYAEVLGFRNKIAEVNDKLTVNKLLEQSLGRLGYPKAVQGFKEGLETRAFNGFAEHMTNVFSTGNTKLQPNINRHCDGATQLGLAAEKAKSGPGK